MNWMKHYEMAEAMLKKSADPNITRPIQELLIAKAQVHATLASVGLESTRSAK